MIEAETRAPVRGILFALGGAVTLSVNDVAIKFLSGSYALHQVILTRAFIGLALVLTVVAVSGTGFRQLLTRRPREQLLRVSLVMVSNVTYFLGLAAMPLADAVATAFIAPIFVTLLSIVVLGEKVGARRWSAVGIGMLGVVVMLRPGAGVIDTESAMALNFFVQVGFVVVSSAMGLWVGDGHLAGSANPSLAFLFRDWVWPPVADWPAFLATGLAVGIGGLMMSQAYRTTEAALVAPFEYAGMPMAILWGATIFGTWPDLTAWAGIALICGAGLYTLGREMTLRRQGRL
jgi:drug/metabolite transporter (DMT)-like permease